MNMTDEQIVDELFKKNEAWRHADENKPVDCYPKPLVHMLDAVFRERINMRQERDRWKATALYLADCHAANAEGSTPKRLSKYDRGRFKGILEKAVGMLKGLWPPHHYSSMREKDVDRIVKRCEQSMQTIEELGV